MFAVEVFVVDVPIPFVVAAILMDYAFAFG